MDSSCARSEGAVMIICANPAAQFHSYQDEIEASVLKVLRSNRYILGEEVEAQETKFTDYIGVHSTIGVANSTDALEIAIRALDIGPGDEVITVSHIKLHDIHAGIHYPMLVHMQPAYKTRIRTAISIRVTEMLAEEVLSLPTYTELETQQISNVVQAVNSFAPRNDTHDRAAQ
jgi:dTDP-4-amino-4,6-dideoxygalactose transaminase